MGRVFQAYYTKRDELGAPILDADGSPKRFPGKGWTIEYTDTSGRTIHRKGGATEDAAKDALRQAEAEILREKNGLPTRRAADTKCRELVEAYLTAQKGRVGKGHLRDVAQRLDYILAAARALTVKDLRPEAVESVLATLADEDLSARTVNTYLQAVKGCLRWAVKRRMLSHNPLDPLAPLPEYATRLRRALNEDEIARLLTAALEGPARRAARTYTGGHDVAPRIPLAKRARLAERGRDNALAYRLMVETGLRKSECRALKWADIDLDAGTLTTRPEWMGNKNRKRETLPLTPGLLAALQQRKAATRADDSAHVVIVTSRLLKNLNDDLLAIGLARRISLDKNGQEILCGQDGKPLKKPATWHIEKRDAAGRSIDLHALRHTCGTRLVAAGVDIKSTQTLMRHAKPSLTLGIYVHADKGRLAAAVQALPEVRPAAIREAGQAVAALAKTGTFDASAPTSSQQGAAECVRESARKSATENTLGSTLPTTDAVPYKQGVTGSSPVSPTIP